MTSPIVNPSEKQPPAYGAGGNVSQVKSGDRTSTCAGAPQLRGSGATLLSLYRPLVLRAAGIGCALLTVAWLGERDSQRTVYGELVTDAAKVPASGEPNAEGREPQRPSSAGAPGAPSTRESEPSAPPPAPSAAKKDGSGSSPCAASSPSAAPLAVTSDGRVILNEATVRELTTLPGVGEKRAEAILELRGRLGRFDKPAQLLRVRGIGPKSLAKLTPKFVLDRPVEPPPAASANPAPAEAHAPSGVPAPSPPTASPRG